MIERRSRFRAAEAGPQGSLGYAGRFIPTRPAIPLYGTNTSLLSHTMLSQLNSLAVPSKRSE